MKRWPSEGKTWATAHTPKQFMKYASVTKHQYTLESLCELFDGEYTLEEIKLIHFEWVLTQ